MKVINGKVVREVKGNKKMDSELIDAIGEIRETVECLRPLIFQLVKGYKLTMQATGEGFMPLADFKGVISTVTMVIKRALEFCDRADAQTSQMEWFDLLQELTDQATIIDGLREKMEEFSANLTADEKESDVINAIEVE